MSKVNRESRKETGEIKGRPRKRKQYFNPKTVETDDRGVSASIKKFKNHKDYSVPEDGKLSYKIIDFYTVFSIISTYIKCGTCNNNVQFSVSDERGLGFKIVLSCEKCNPRYVPSCSFIGHGYEINRRIIFAMRLLGIGFKGLTKFCALMDLPMFLSKSTYRILLEQLYNACKSTAEYFMKKAAKEEVIQNGNNTDITVSGDGTWHKRGFSSLYGVVTLIGHHTCKVVDLIVKSSYCKFCEYWKTKRGTATFEEEMSNHERECKANHKGSSGKMEVDGIIEMFRRSLKNLAVRFLNYVGDGDSKTYSGILNAKPYGETLVNKRECIGHVQKRMGTRLRKLVKTYKTVQVKSFCTKTIKPNTKKTKSAKGLGGKGRLTGKMIDKLAVYYGKAIREHCKSDCIDGMKDAIWSTYYHLSSTDKKPIHHKCPKGENSWCVYQKAKAAGQLKNFVHDYKPLPPDILKAIKPIYQDLSKKELLERCLGGYTQNSNESCNQSIWKIMPKNLPASATTVGIAAYVAACEFNEGTRGLLAILNCFGVKCGRNSHAYARRADAERIEICERRTSENTREARMQRRQQQIASAETANEEEGILYGPGIDDSM